MAATRVTRPFPLADGALRKDLPRLVRHWNMNNKVNDNNGRCALGTAGEMQEWVNSWVTENRYEVVDFEPDWSIITFRRLGGGGRSADRKPEPSLPVATKPAVASTKYVEVPGPDGPVRLSPEVAARNQAAAEEYRRKMDENARAKAEYERAKAEHDRKLAQHGLSIANADAERREHERKLAANEAEVAAHKAALTKPAAKAAIGWMYCEARGSVGDKRRFYSKISEVEYVPGEITILDVMGKNRATFKAYIAGAHAVAFTTDSLVHCPYSTDNRAGAESQDARDKRGDRNNQIESVQTGWTPSS